MIGKGNPPAAHQNQHQRDEQQQQQNENLSSQTGLSEKGRHSPQLSTLHVPQPRVPVTNPFAQLQLHSLVGLGPQQAVGLTEQSCKLLEDQQA